jgi:hypothetical protein
MEACVECTHCRVLMTSWAAPGSPVRYWQCPFCGRTHSSAYGEVFRNGAGARLIARAVAGPPSRGTPARASPAEVDWPLLKARAVRWFARLEAEGQPPRRAAAGERCSPAGSGSGRLPGRHR